MHKLRLVLLLRFLLLAAGLCQCAVGSFDLPLSSQHAMVMQRIGVTDITVNYHRPLVNGRKIFGRTGAVRRGMARRRERQYDHHLHRSVTIEGQPLAAGPTACT